MRTCGTKKNVSFARFLTTCYVAKPMKKFTPVFILVLSVFLTGCHQPEVKFTDMRPAPTATVASNAVTIHLGSDMLTSADWVHPKVKIEGQTIYVFGYLTLQEQSREYIVRLPAPVNSQSVSIVWIDPDGSHVTVPIVK